MEPLHDSLADHGDRQVPDGAVDLAVNVWGPPPDWLLAELARVDLAAYPDPTPGVAAVAARHGVTAAECLLLNGAAEAFWLVAQALRPRLAACVHPSFTAPEAALRAAGVPVHRVLRDPDAGFALDPAAVPEEADLVVLGRPDNPTGRLEPPEVIAQLARPGRVIVVDEAFADFLPDGSSVYTERIPGLVCVRSLTKLWGLAGLRVGYLLAGPELTSRLAAVRQPWPVSSLAVHATTLLVGAEEERRQRADAVAAARASLLEELAPLRLTVWPSAANFLLVRGEEGLRSRLLDLGLAVRRAETFPGLDGSYVRVAVHPDPAVRDALVAGLRNEPARPSSRTLVLGGARSGKSTHAQRLLSHEQNVLYVAPGPVPDDADTDWAARVEAHQRDRPETWTTCETTDVAGVLAKADRPVLVDCFATWLAATMDAVGAWEPADGATGWEERLDAELDRLLEAWLSVTVPVVAVSNEVGSGVVPSTRSGLLFRDALGRLNQRLAAASDDVRLVVAGRVQRLGQERA
jgi:histidinol-phosphate/aromatic aminotransferase/cobyric acid decarboxylase-like protein/adenosyl cobinamide kinase/adenosyl cobinamide phosphate guanylyltransferase